MRAAATPRKPDTTVESEVAYEHESLLHEERREAAHCLQYDLPAFETRFAVMRETPSCYMTLIPGGDDVDSRSSLTAVFAVIDNVRH